TLLQVRRQLQPEETRVADCWRPCAAPDLPFEMNWVTTFLRLTIAGAVVATGWTAPAVESSWHTVPGGRWVELRLPATGKTGFTLLSPEQTGVTFSNTVAEWQSASNRVLLNGSGVAVGDF